MRSSSHRRGRCAGLRVVSRGKQPGDPGFRLEQRPDPDEVRVHTPEICRGCGDSLQDAAVVGQESRQVFDLPPIELVVIEHQAERRACGCGVVTTATFPAEAIAPTCYGPGVAALGASRRRARGLLAQAKGFSISAMSVAMPVLLFGVFALLEQQMVSPFAGQTWLYVALLAVWGAYELRPAKD